MNAITMVVTVLTLWLVMGLGFLSKYIECKVPTRDSCLQPVWSYP